MIAKCALIALLAAVASARPGFEEFDPSCLDFGCQSSPAALVSAAASSVSVTGPSTITKNLIGKGRYPVALSGCGPTSGHPIPVTTSQVTAPTQERPTVRLPANIPPPRVVSHTCTCYKTIVKPRVHQQIITVPVIHRYLQTTHKPVVESYKYEAEPVNCQSGSSQIQTVQIPQVQAVQVPEVQTVQVPQVQAVQVPEVQTVQVPQLQTVQVPQVQSVQVPQVQTVQVPQVQTVQVPQVQTVQVPQVQSVQIPQFQTVQVPQVQTVEVPQVQTVEVPRLQTVEVPRVQTVEVPRVQSAEIPSISFGGFSTGSQVEIPKSFSFGGSSSGSIEIPRSFSF